MDSVAAPHSRLKAGDGDKSFLSLGAREDCLFTAAVGVVAVAVVRGAGLADGGEMARAEDEFDSIRHGLQTLSCGRSGAKSDGQSFSRFSKASLSVLSSQITVEYLSSSRVS